MTVSQLLHMLECGKQNTNLQIWNIKYEREYLHQFFLALSLQSLRVKRQLFRRLDR